MGVEYWTRGQVLEFLSTSLFVVGHVEAVAVDVSPDVVVEKKCFTVGAAGSLDPKWAIHDITRVRQHLVWVEPVRPSLKTVGVDVIFDLAVAVLHLETVVGVAPADRDGLDLLTQCLKRRVEVRALGLGARRAATASCPLMSLNFMTSSLRQMIS